MSQGPLCPNLTKKGQAEVSQMANRNLSRVILLGGLSVNLNHLKKVILDNLFLHISANFEVTIQKYPMLQKPANFSTSQKS